MNPDLSELAAAHGVATSYRGEGRRLVEVDDDVVVRVLGLLDVDAATPRPARRRWLAPARRQPSARCRARSHTGPARPPAARTGRADQRRGHADRRHRAARRPRTRLLPAGAGRRALGREVTVVVAPAALPEMPRSWGWMLQLYALHSQGSWGIGDLGDLREFVGWTGREHGAEAVLLNPLHAITPVPPVQASPYTPSSRRFATPLALRVTDLELYREADDDTRAEVDALRPDTVDDRIEHDRVWAAKRSACELLWHAAGRPEPIGLPDDMWQFAIFCAIAERYGGRWSRWPEGLRHPASPDVDRLRDRAGPARGVPRLAAGAGAAPARRRARDRPGGRGAGGARPRRRLRPRGRRRAGRCRTSSRWACTSALPRTPSASRARTGACRRGAPNRLDATGYAAYRDLLRALLRQADGLRIDHVAGLWRLWWVPPGDSPRNGTYVHYDAEVMLAVLTLEAWGAGALVIGEDLGHGGAGGHRGPGRAQHPGLVGALVHPRRGRARRAAAAAREVERGVRRDGVDARPADGVGVPARRARARPGRARPARRPGRARRPAPRSTGWSWWSCCASRAWSAATTRARTSWSSPCTRCSPAAGRGWCWSRPTTSIGETRQPNLPGTVDQYPNWRLPAAREPGGAARRPPGAGGDRRAAPRPPEEQRLTCTSFS